jgi:murein DD-endopeptidase MepM/ murein hydrolase activator NlpD
MTRRRIVLGAILLLAVAAPPASGDLYSRKQSVDSRLSAVNQKLAAARAREHALRGQIESVTSQIRTLEAQVGDVSSRLSTLERDLALHRERLARLTELFRLQTRRLTFLRREYRLALLRLDRRIVEIYQSGEVGTLDVVLSASSMSDLLDGLDYVNQIGAQDERIAHTVQGAKVRMKIIRQRTRKTRSSVSAATRSIAVRTAQVRAVRDTLVARQGALSSARSQKQTALASTHENVQQALDDAAALSAESGSIAARIRAAEASAASSSSSPSSSSSSSTAHVSSAGLIWPVNGPVVSPFGYRCLYGICRMHEGIDIAASSGTPIHAAAAGTVIFAGVESGYGNFMIVDHGNGLATAYAHQSGFAVSAGAHVAQGQVIGYVGCTGHCYGPHLHFEVRVHGTAVDPLGYL